MRCGVWIGMILAGAMPMGAGAAEAGGECSVYVGTKITTTDFDTVYARLPNVAPKDDYESQEEYQKRLDTANSTADINPVFVRVNLRPGLSYDPDKKMLRVYRHNFGIGQTNFREVLKLPYERGADTFSNAIRFTVSSVDTGTETYTASNGFGAQFQVEKTYRTVGAVFERSGEIGKSPIVEMKGFGPLLFPMPPERARAIVEQGGPALLIIPKAPFRADGLSRVMPSYRFRMDISKIVRVIHADIRCAFLLDDQQTVFAAFTVR